MAADLVTTSASGRYRPDPSDTSEVGPQTTTLAPELGANGLGVEIKAGNRGIGLHLVQDRWHQPAAGVPALVWEAKDDAKVVIVTMDGGRYDVDASSLRSG